MSQFENTFENVLKKAEQEYSDFLDDLKGQGFEEIIGRTYEILTKQEFLAVLQNCSGTDLIGLRNTDRPLERLFQDWLERDEDYRGLLEESAGHYLRNAAMAGLKKAKQCKNTYSEPER